MSGAGGVEKEETVTMESGSRAWKDTWRKWGQKWGQGPWRQPIWDLYDTPSLSSILNIVDILIFPKQCSSAALSFKYFSPCLLYQGWVWCFSMSSKIYFYVFFLHSFPYFIPTSIHYQDLLILPLKYLPNPYTFLYFFCHHSSPSHHNPSSMSASQWVPLLSRFPF